MHINTVLLELKKYDSMQETLEERKNLLEEQHIEIRNLQKANKELLNYISEFYIKTLSGYAIDMWDGNNFGDYSSYNEPLNEIIEIGKKHDKDFGDKLIKKITDLKHGTIESVEK